MEKTVSDNMVTPLEKIPSGSSVPDVALFIPTACGGGGAERVMIFLANGFSQQGLAVDLLVVSAEGPFLKEVSETVRIVDLSPAQGRYYLRLILRLVLYLRQVRPCHLLSAMNIYNFVSKPLVRRRQNENSRPMHPGIGISYKSRECHIIRHIEFSRQGFEFIPQFPLT